MTYRKGLPDARFELGPSAMRTVASTWGGRFTHWATHRQFFNTIQYNTIQYHCFLYNLKGLVGCQANESPRQAKKEKKLIWQK